MPRELSRGAIAGAAGGALMAAVLLMAGEGPLQRAIDRQGPAGDALVPRAGQRAGGVAAALIVGVALGVVLAFVGEVLRRRRAGGTTEPWWSSVALAAAAFATVSLVPFLRYPANPPGVGSPETIGARTGAYVLLLGWALVAGWAGWRCRRELDRRGVAAPLAVPAAVVTTVVLVALGYAVLPPGPDPGAVPAGELWSFRLASLGAWGAYWAAAGTVLAWLRLPAVRLRPSTSDRTGAPA